MDASPEAQWLVERSELAGYVIIVIPASLGGRGVMRSYAFACPSEPSGWHILLLVGAYYVGGRALYWWRRRSRKGQLVKKLRKCNE